MIAHTLAPRPRRLVTDVAAGTSYVPLLQADIDRFAPTIATCFGAFLHSQAHLKASARARETLTFLDKSCLGILTTPVNRLGVPPRILRFPGPDPNLDPNPRPTEIKFNILDAYSLAEYAVALNQPHTQPGSRHPTETKKVDRILKSWRKDFAAILHRELDNVAGKRREGDSDLGATAAAFPARISYDAVVAEQAPQWPFRRVAAAGLMVARENGRWAGAGQGELTSPLT